MFKSRGFRSHAKKVVGMLDAAVDLLGPDLKALEETLIQLGAKHVGHGILPEHYPIVGEALLKTLATGLGDAFTPELESSWGGVYGFITKSMLQGANESLLRVSFPVYGGDNKHKSAKEEVVTLDEYISSMLPNQRHLFYITAGANADTFNLAKVDKMQKATALQQAGVTILHVAKNKKDLYVTNLEKYMGRQMIDVEAAEDEDFNFLPEEARAKVLATAVEAPVGGKAGKPDRKARQAARKAKKEGQEDDVDIDTLEKQVRRTSITKIDDLEKAAAEEKKARSTSPNSVVVTTTYSKEGLTEEQSLEFCNYLQATVGKDKVVKCTPTCKFASQPARVIHDESDQEASAQKERHLEDYNSRLSPKKHVEINPNHVLVVEICRSRKRHPDIAKMLVEQMYDNCLINAGLLEDPRIMVTRMNDLSLALLHEKNSADC